MLRALRLDGARPVAVLRHARLAQPARASASSFVDAADVATAEAAALHAAYLGRQQGPNGLDRLWHGVQATRATRLELSIIEASTCAVLAALAAACTSPRPAQAESRPEVHWTGYGQLTATEASTLLA
jgi:hypothetical protein